MAELIASGDVRKMQTALAAPVKYTLVLGEQAVAMNDYVGKALTLEYQGEIHCIHCNRKTNKSFSQGYCYPCFKRLAQCDSCIMSPEKCHYHEGTCREPEWGDQHCMTDHIVYLANTSGLKVGITRASQVPTRWMDQGATQAQPVFRVATRQQSGLVETLFKNHIADKTNWQAMLKGDAEDVDLEALRAQLMAECGREVAALQDRFGVQAITELENQSTVKIQYPVLEYPLKVKSFNLDKVPTAGGVLLGIKGQYLMFDNGVINLRKYGGYRLSLSAPD